MQLTEGNPLALSLTFIMYSQCTPIVHTQHVGPELLPNLKIANWDLLKQEFGIHLYTDPSLFVGINISNIIVAEFMIIVSIIRNVSRVYTLPVLGTCILWWKRCVVSLLFAVLLPLHLLMLLLLTKFKKHPLVYTCVCDVLDRCNNTQ